MTRAERLEIAQFLADIMQDVQQCSYAEYPDTRDHIAQFAQRAVAFRDGKILSDQPVADRRIARRKESAA